MEGRTWRRMWADRTISTAFSARDNSFGFLRLFFALAVLVSHSWPIGLGQEDPGGGVTRGQTVLGEVSVIGFFVISGFLITRSGLRFGLGRYLWHRALRILPGLWACLIVTAVLIGPIAALIERGTMSGYWRLREGPFTYIATNWFIKIEQWDISGILTERAAQHPNTVVAFDGSLWSLVYEALCYLMIGTLAIIGVLRRARWFTLAATTVAFLLILANQLHVPGIGRIGDAGPAGAGLDRHDLLYLTYVFLLGALAELYRERIPMNDGGALVAGVTLLVTLSWTGFWVLGLPAFAYLVLWLAIRLPKPLQAVGRGRDYSYGIYVYAFPIQQVLLLLGVPDLGLPAFMALSLLGTLALAIPSWHLVERPAMGWKDWTPQRLAARSATASTGPAAPSVPTQPEPTPPAPRAPAVAMPPGRHRAAEEVATPLAGRD